MKIKTRLQSGLPSVAKASAAALVGATLVGFAVPGTASAASTTPTTYTAQAQSEGLVINLFGTQLTGGVASANVDTATLSASAQGVGTLTPGLVEDQKAAVTGDNQSQDFKKACAQGGSAPSSSPLGVTLGLSCSSATAGIANGVPTATATGEIAGLDVNATSVLNQIISSGGNQLFSGIQQILGQLNGTPLGSGTTVCPDPNSSSGTSSGSTSGSGGTSSGTGTNPLSALAGTASTPGTPLNGLLGSLGLSSSPAASSPGPLGNLLNGLCQTLNNIQHLGAGTSTLVVDVGPASASVLGTAADTATASAAGATAEIQILPGVGCAASLAECISNPTGNAVPLIDIKVAPAEADDSFSGGVWTPSTKSALATVDLNIPGDAQTITVSPGQHLDLLAGTPLETVIDLGSATTSGSSDTANGATLDVAKGVNNGILLDLGSSRVTSGVKAATVAAKTSPAAQIPPAATPVQSAPPELAASPTLVHTGAWWSGSMPYIGGLAALGGGLLGWPRLRRTSKGLGALLRAARR